MVEGNHTRLDGGGDEPSVVKAFVAFGSADFEFEGPIVRKFMLSEALVSEDALKKDWIFLCCFPGPDITKQPSSTVILLSVCGAFPFGGCVRVRVWGGGSSPRW